LGGGGLNCGDLGISECICFYLSNEFSHATISCKTPAPPPTKNFFSLVLAL